MRRLEGSIREDDLGAVIFRDAQTFGLMDWQARLIRAIERKNKQRWDEDHATYFEAIDTIHRVLKNAPHLVTTGQYPGGLQDLTDLTALVAIEILIAADSERRVESPEDVRFEEWWRRVQDAGTDRTFGSQRRRGESVAAARLRIGRELFDTLDRMIVTKHPDGGEHA
ncbi:MAG: hypothetical protein JOZ58_04670 [Acetobacteraceae bacterium]|nr:hypothetical protein [Acetobacteraceae bacterium]